MKKIAVRFMTAALALGMAFSMTAMTASAKSTEIHTHLGIGEDHSTKFDEAIVVIPDVNTAIVDKDHGASIDGNKILDSMYNWGPYHFYKSQYKMIDFGGADTWDFIGVGPKTDAPANNGKYKYYVPSYSQAGGEKEWVKLYQDGEFVMVLVPHVHRIGPNAPWYGDNNNHWKICPQCHEFALMNWHHDVDNDGICDQCGHEIVYRHVTVKDSEGGSVKSSVEKGMLGNRVTVTVTPDAGYKLQQLRAQNDNGKSYSIRPCYEDVKGSEYHFFLDVWDVELNAEFVKE